MLGCSLDSDILAEFPTSLCGIYASTTQPSSSFTAGYVANQINGWNIALEQAAQTNTVEQISKTHEVNPYGDQLRYCGGLERVFNKSTTKEILLDRVEFYVYDSIVVGSGLLDADGNLFQTAATINEIKASALTNTKIYAQSPTNNGMPGQWQPNWFRPKMELNGSPILGDGGNGVSGNDTTVDQSMGMPIPHCESFHRRINFTVSKIDIFAKCAQYIGVNVAPPAPVTGVLQRYPVLALVYFRLQ